MTPELHPQPRKQLSRASIFIIALVIFVLSRAFFVDFLLVPTGSMNPTIVEGDFILTNKLAYGLRLPFTKLRLSNGALPSRGDIVVFYSPTGSDTLVKRVVGLPGDVVAMNEERLIVNGVDFQYRQLGQSAGGDLVKAMVDSQPQLYEESTSGLASRRIAVFSQKKAKRNFGPIKVPPGQLLVLGDNRDNSRDSRYLGFVPAENLIGHSFAVAISVNPDNFWKPRWHRFGLRLN